MSAQTIYLIIGLICLVLVFIVPQMIALRVKILNWLKLRRLAAWHERHIQGLSIIIRIILLALAIYMFYLAF